MSTARHPTPPLTVANINIERSKHLPQVMSFLARITADVVCLQELIVDDLFRLSRSLGYAHHAYVPMALHPGDGLIRPFGIGILSRIPILRSESVPYAGLGSGRDLVDLSSAESKVRTSRYFVVLVTVALADARFTIGNTHFPWTPEGSASDDQREACDRLIGLLGERPVVLCGDFNAPRGGEIFSRLAAHWRDNIPARYTSSIDPNLHRAGPLPLMVDAAFSTTLPCSQRRHARGRQRSLRHHCRHFCPAGGRPVREHVAADVEVGAARACALSSRKIHRVRVTSGAFLSSSQALRKRAVCPVASAPSVARRLWRHAGCARHISRLLPTACVTGVPA